MKNAFGICLTALTIASLGHLACSSDESTPATGGAAGSSGASGAAGTGGSVIDGGAGSAGANDGGGGTTVDGGAGASGAVDGGAEGSTDAAPTDGGEGACTNSTDYPIAEDPATIEKVQQCALKNFGAEPATKTCIKDQTGMSDACVTCWDDSVACTGKNCMAQCVADSKSAECKDCMDTNCMPAFYPCSGLSP